MDVEKLRNREIAAIHELRRVVEERVAEKIPLDEVQPSDQKPCLCAPYWPPKRLLPGVDIEYCEHCDAKLSVAPSSKFALEHDAVLLCIECVVKRAKDLPSNELLKFTMAKDYKVS